MDVDIETRTKTTTADKKKLNFILFVISIV